MGYFDNDANVDAYIEMADGYDGRELVALLERMLLKGATVLELGMGPGKDLQLLGRQFVPTGSDESSIFVDRYRAAHPDADVMRLDAVTVATDRRFDAIYSNKVLHHLTVEEARRSLQSQRAVLKVGGLALHSLWRGDTVEEHHGLRFQNYTAQTFANVVGNLFDIVETGAYAEMSEDDSLYVVLRRPADEDTPGIQ